MRPLGPEVSACRPPQNPGKEECIHPAKPIFLSFVFLIDLLFFFSFELFVLYQDTADQQCCDSFR